MCFVQEFKRENSIVFKSKFRESYIKVVRHKKLREYVKYFITQSNTCKSTGLIKKKIRF